MADDAPGGPATVAERWAQQVFRVRFEEAGPTGMIRTSTLLRYAAELAWLHSEHRGFGRPWYQERGLAWLVRGVDVRLLRPIEDGATVIGTTRVVAARRVIARRRSEFRSIDGDLAAVVDVDWAMTSSAGVPTRVPEVFALAFGVVPGATFEPVRVRPVPPPGVELAPTTRVRRYEIDPMRHVNNAVYLDWAEDAIAAAADHSRPAMVDALPRRWRLEYHGAARPASAIRATAWRDPVGGWLCLVDDAISGERYVGAGLSAGDGIDAP